MRHMSALEDALFENGVFPVIIADFHKRSISGTNGVFAEWFRIEDPEFSSISFDLSLEEIIASLEREGILRELYLSLPHRNGNRIRCLATAHNIGSGEGRRTLIILHESLSRKEEVTLLKYRSSNLSTLTKDMMDMAFWSLDTRLNFIDFNEKLANLLKNTCNYVLRDGDSFLENIPDFMGVSWKDRFEKGLKGIRAEYSDEFFGGIMKTIISPVFTDYGEVAGLCCAIEDRTTEINRRKNHEILHQRFISILNSSADAAIIVTDPEGIVRQFNRGASAMLGYGREEIIGKTDLLRFFAPSFLREVGNFINRRKDEKIKRNELFPWFSDNPQKVKELDWRFLNKQGKSIDIKISISPVLIDDESYGGLLIIAQDISELKKIKEELETSKQQAEEISRTKTSFLANMSHEIRTPLNGIIGMADLLNHTELSETQRNHASVILKSARTLLLLINDILDYTRIEAGKFKLGLSPFSLSSLIDDIREMMIVNIRERNIDFNIYIDKSVPDRVVGDQRRIKQILLNLVGNAMKFTLEGSINLEIYQISEKRNRATLYFKVVDTGIGISETEKKKLFQTFSQVDSSATRKHSGSGLGLAISKELVMMMDGEIGLESTPGSGSTFWFTVKLVRDTVEFEDKRVLVANPNRTSRRTLSKSLKSLGLQVSEAASLSEAEEKLKTSEEENRTFDILFADESLHPENLWKTAVIGSAIVRTSYGGGSGDGKSRSFLKLPVSMGELEKTLTSTMRKSIGSRLETETAILPDSGDTGNESIRILVAEDNKINQLVTMNFLKKLGYAADLVCNGKEAVEAYNSRYYDIILMDQMMPEMDGIEATAKIREGGSGKSNRDVIIIALTANAMKGDRQILLEAGMDDYIAKPVLLKDIKTILARNLDKRKV